MRWPVTNIAGSGTLLRHGQVWLFGHCCTRSRVTKQTANSHSKHAHSLAMSVTLLQCKEAPAHAVHWLPARHNCVSVTLHPHEHLLPRLHRCPPAGRHRRSCQLRHQPASHPCLGGPLHGAARRPCHHRPPLAARRTRHPHHSATPRLGRRRRRLPRCLVQTRRLPRLQRRPGRRPRGRRRQRRSRRRCFRRRRRPRGLLRGRAARRRRPSRLYLSQRALPAPARPAAARARPPRTRAARRGPPRSPR